jgi:Ca2+-binding EF-hand superfamily protein
MGTTTSSPTKGSPQNNKSSPERLGATPSDNWLKVQLLQAQDQLEGVTATMQHVIATMQHDIDTAQCYGFFRALEKAKPGSLRQNFERFDADGNNELDVDELRHMIPYMRCANELFI